MMSRILSQVVCRTYILAAAALTFGAGSVCAQNGPGYYSDPQTGIVYRRSVQNIQRPVVEMQMERQDQTVYRPETVTETTPQTRTIYTPVVEYRWEPKVRGRWNPFQRPSVVYQHVPRTHWEARNEVVSQTRTRTQWVAEKRSVEVPRQIVRMESDQKVDLQPVGRLTQPGAGPRRAENEIASRLRPLDTNQRYQPLSQPTRFASAAPNRPLASTWVGQTTSDPQRRSLDQGGMRATTLSPGMHSQPLPPASNSIGIASRPFSFFR